MDRREFLGCSAAFAALGASAADVAAAKVKVIGGAAFFAGPDADASGTVIVDLRDSVRYPSHPEIATAASREPAAVAKALAAWKARGVAVVPLLDFCAARDEWLGEYDWMLGSKRYHVVVADLIRDVATLFEKPSYIHIGFASEDLDAYPAGARYYAMRQGDLWMRALNWTCERVRENGAKPWVWFDYPWKIEDFLAGCPTDARYTNFRPLDVKRYVWKYSQLKAKGLETVDLEGGAK